MNTNQNLVNQNEMKGGISHLDIFNYENLGQVRTYVDDSGEPWFCHKDVCDILGITDPHVAMRRLADPGVCSIPVGVQTGVKADGNPAQQTVLIKFINEGNLFRLMTSSRKAEAKTFTNWVCDIVLPELRKKNMFDPSKYTQLDVLKLIVDTMEKEKREIHARLDYIDGKVNWLADTFNTIHNEMLEYGFYTISSFGKIYNKGLSYETCGKLGREATALCESYGLPVSIVESTTYPFTKVNSYPATILKMVFEEEFNEEFDITIIHEKPALPDFLRK